MEEKNPLQIGLPLRPPTKDKITNKSGRPTTKDIIKFGPQPMSIIAEMLRKVKTKNIDDKDEIVCLNDQTEDSLEVDKPGDHICTFCSQRFNTAEELKVHITIHKQFSCDFPNCTYSCKLSSNLIKHRRVHTNDKPYLCEQCSFRSNFVNSLKAHRRIHTTERPHKCKYCTYECNSSSNLKKHCRQRHPESTKVRATKRNKLCKP